MPTKDTTKNKEQQNFFERVFEVVRQIPEGRVTNYGAIAKYLGAARSSRMVGWAMNQSHSQSATNAVPAHRVVNRLGILTGKHHFEDPKLMQQLLESEGVMVEDDQVQNFKEVFWDPCTALDID